MFSFYLKIALVVVVSAITFAYMMRLQRNKQKDAEESFKHTISSLKNKKRNKNV